MNVHIGRRETVSHAAAVVWRDRVRPELAQTARATWTTTRARLRARKARPHLAMLGVPLAMIAGTLTQPLVVPPLILCAWWWAPRTVAIEWTVACGRGLIGTEWALIGANAVIAFPHQTLLVGACWAASALALGVMSYVFRLRG